MAKTANPMDAHRRQERKKLIQKNKKARISARDEQVVKTKSVGEIKKAIAEAESKRNKSHSEMMKLQRLQKELKLVEAAVKTAPPKPIVQKTPAQLMHVDDARKSVYYDAKMNPYGAPPPGKPRLYHRADGGVTMNPKDAVVPGKQAVKQQQEEQRKQQQPQYITGYGNDGSALTSAASGGESYAPPVIATCSIPPPPPPPPKERPPVAKRAVKPTTKSVVPPPPPKVVDPSIVPSLPQASKAVKRNKRKLATDIWASQQEVDYERHAGVDLEEVSSGNKKQKNLSNKNWYYKDASGILQGPFDSMNMNQWRAAGYFPPTTMVRNGKEGKFVAVSTIHTFGNNKMAPKKDVAQARTDALRREPDEPPDDVLARIVALRGDRQQAADDEQPPDDVLARIAVLRGDRPAQQEANDQPSDDVLARIAALRGDRPAQQEATEESSGDVQARIDALRSGNSQPIQTATGDNTGENGTQARIGSLRQSSAGDIPLLPNESKEDISNLRQASQGETQIDNIRANALRNQDPSVDEQPSAACNNDGGVQARINALRNPPKRAPVEEPPMYPAAVGAYPVDAYPVDTGAYPVDESYPVDVAYPMDVAYPVADTYPIDNRDGMGVVANDEPVEKKLGVVKVDAAVVGFMPSHLQKKRAAPAARKPKAAPKAPAAVNEDTKGDDLDAFMKEISDL